MAELVLTGPQRGKLRQALMHAFPSVADLQIMTNDQLGENLLAIIPNNADLEEACFALIAWCNARSRLGELFLSARAANPGNTRLFAFGRGFGLTASNASKNQLEKFVTGNTTHVDVAKWRAQLTKTEFVACRVDIGNQGKGTGFLVGPDLVLTNYHVLPKVIERVTPATKVSCLFDYKAREDGSVINGGRRVALAPGDTWLVDASPFSEVDLAEDPKPGAPAANELDYALLRLAEAVGEQPRGRGGENRRGWVNLSAAPIDFESITAISILQHPRALPLKLALDWNQTLKLEGENRRLRHTIPTEPGSSGSPLFDADWRLVALHHSGDPATVKPAYNEAIPIPLIAVRPKVAAALPEEDE